MGYCYIIFSKKLNVYYTGITSENPEKRLERHVSKHYEGYHFTHSASDWNIFLSIKCNNMEQARMIEVHIKKMKSKKYIQNLKKHSEMREKLLRKYS